MTSSLIRDKSWQNDSYTAVKMKPTLKSIGFVKQ